MNFSHAIQNGAESEEHMKKNQIFLMFVYVISVSPDGVFDAAVAVDPQGGVPAAGAAVLGGGHGDG